MKLAALFATIALAQEEGDGRAMSLQKKIDNAGKKCSVYMEKAMVCEPPSSKIGKYNFRLEKVLKDAQHHLKVGKCDEKGYGGYDGYRRRRSDEESEELENEFDTVMQEIADSGFTGKQYGSSANQSQLKKLESLCEKFIGVVFKDESLQNCGKLGAWQNRSSQIFDDLVAMKNVCIKQAENPEPQNNNGGGGSYNAPANNKPANNNNAGGNYNGGNNNGGNAGGNYNGGKKPNNKPNKKPNNNNRY